MRVVGVGGLAGWARAGPERHRAANTAAMADTKPCLILVLLDDGVPLFDPIELRELVERADLTGCEPGLGDLRLQLLAVAGS
jgi:hypothetical protein